MPGFMTHLNPKLIEKMTYVQQLTAILQNTAIDKNEKCVRIWMGKTTNNETHQGLQVPKFYIEQSSQKWGKLKTDILRVNGAEDDAQYLKYLLSTASASGDIKKGLFTPTGIHLMGGKEVLTSILNNQNQYLQSTIGIPITGVSRAAMKQTDSSGNKSVEQELLGSKLLDSVEPINLTEKIGKWILVVNKEK